MAEKKIKITVQTVKAVDQFRRAGFVFTFNPQTVEVDENQLAIIKNEPMLMIVKDKQKKDELKKENDETQEADKEQDKKGKGKKKK